MPRTRLSLSRIAAGACLLAGIAGVGMLWRGYVLQARDADALRHAADTAPPALAPQAVTHRHLSAHFAIESTASDTDTVEVGAAADALHAAWSGFFASELTTPQASDARLRMRLYGSQAEFKAHNRSRPWAEAFYLKPVSHAYVARGRGNRYHWMLHEVVHQLNTEVLGRRHTGWIEEGLACYFGASRLVDGTLQPGNIDPDAYPAWWLQDHALTDNAAADARRLRMIPLRAMLTGQGVPSLDRNVNLHYVQHWTLVHFLLHGEGGRHAEGFRRLMATPAGLEDFERLIGPVDTVEVAWRAHRGVMLAQLQSQSQSQSQQQ